MCVSGRNYNVELLVALFNYKERLIRQWQECPFVFDVGIMVFRGNYQFCECYVLWVDIGYMVQQLAG